MDVAIFYYYSNCDWRCYNCGNANREYSILGGYMLLTDEEMDKIIANVEDCNTRFGLIFAKAQHKKTVEWFIEEIERYCVDGKKHGRQSNYASVRKRECRACWQAIKDKARK